MTTPCTKEKQINEMDKCIAVLKSRWKMVGAVISGCLILLGIYTRMVTSSSANAQSAQAETITKMQTKDESAEKRITALEVAVGVVTEKAENIEKNVDKALEESDKKQQQIIDAIKDLKKEE